VSDIISRRVTIRNKLGLHARAASLLVRLASGFGAEITLELGGTRANAKSIMGILMLAAGQGSDLLLTAAGDDAAQAVAALVTLIEEETFNEP
jgi:phosphotransferase system HPr (HPr) family protein